MKFKISKFLVNTKERIKRKFLPITSKLITEKRQKNFFVGYIALLLGLLVLRDVFNFGINKIVFVVLYLLIAVLSTNKYFLYSFAFTIPFRIGLPDLYIVLIFFVSFVFRFFDKISVKRWILISCIPAFFFLLEILLSFIYGNVVLENSIRLFLMLFILGICFYNKDIFSYKHILFILAGYVIAYLIITLGSIEVAFWGVKHSNREWLNFKNIFKSYRFGSKKQIINYINTGLETPYPYNPTILLEDNSNNIGLSALIGSATAYFVFPIVKSKKEKILTAILGIVIAIFGFWGLSRSFILFELILAVFIMIFSILHKRKDLVDTLIIVFTIVLVISLFLLFNNDFLYKILKRFYESSTLTGGGRLTLIRDYFVKMFSSLKFVLFGTGCTNLQKIYGFQEPPHTNFVQIGCSYGLPVLILFITFIIISFIKTRRRVRITNYKFGFYIPLIFGFLFTLTNQIFLPTGILSMFIMAAILASYNDKENVFIIPDEIKLEHIKDNINNKVVFCTNDISIVEKTYNNITFDLQTISTNELYSLYEKNNPSFVFASFENFEDLKKICEITEKLNSTIVIGICKQIVKPSLKEKIFSHLISEKVFIYFDNEISIINFKGLGYSKRHKKKINSVNNLSVSSFIGFYSRKSNSKIKKITKFLLSPSKWKVIITRKIVSKYCLNKNVDDKDAISKLYFASFLKEMNWENPITFNEKLNWLKVNYRKHVFVDMADKYEVKKLVEKKLGKQITAKTLDVFNSVDDIDFKAYKFPYVLKTTHNSGCVKVVRGPQDIDANVLNMFRSKLSENYYWKSREWIYKDIKPRIIVEEFLSDAINDVLPVYKFFCFNGEPFILQAIKNDKSTKESIDYFDMDWNRLDLRQNFKTSKIPLEKPSNFQEMKDIARKLSEGMPFIRVDLYSVNGQIYFSEYTFFSDAGFAKFKPKKWDKILGDKIILPKETREDL